MDITTLLEFNKVLPINKARLLMGPAGIGKSSVIKMIADSDKAEFIDIRLSQFEPQDFVGLPYLAETSEGTKVTNFAQPFWWPTDSSARVHLLLDEVDRCREDMHPIAMQLTLDRSIGGRRLHDNVTVWAACNGEEYITIPIDQALMDRFAVVRLTPTVSEWLSWAEASGVHTLVVEFIKANPDHLDTPDKLIGKPNTVSPSRRSWSDVGFLLNKLPDPTSTESLGEFVTAFVGMEASAAFSTWVREKYKPISSDLIFSGKIKPEGYNLVQLSFASENVADLFMSKTYDQQYNALRFFKDAGHEAFASLFEALPDEAAVVIPRFIDIHQYILDTKKKIISSADL